VGEPRTSPFRLRDRDKEETMFGALYDKADWSVAALLIAAMVIAVFI
jgi:hypothetical protein